MARRSSSFSTRVALIAAAITAALAVLVLTLSRLGSPAGPVVEPEPDEALPPVAGVGGEADTGPELPAASTEPLTLQLFLIDTASSRLVPRVRRMEAPMTLPSQAQLAVEQLIAANPIGFISPLPPGTLVREVWVSPGGVAYVDFEAGLPALLAGGTTSEIMAVYGLIGTLTASFPEIRLVQILVDGSPVESLTGHLDLSRPLGPLADWLY